MVNHTFAYAGLHGKWFKARIALIPTVKNPFLMAIAWFYLQTILLDVRQKFLKVSRADINFVIDNYFATIVAFPTTIHPKPRYASAHGRW